MRSKGKKTKREKRIKKKQKEKDKDKNKVIGENPLSIYNMHPQLSYDRVKMTRTFEVTLYNDVEQN